MGSHPTWHEDQRWHDLLNTGHEMPNKLIITDSTVEVPGEFHLCVKHLTITGLSNSIRSYVWPCSFLCLEIHPIRHPATFKWAVDLVTADGHFNLSPQGFVWACNKCEQRRSTLSPFEFAVLLSATKHRSILPVPDYATARPLRPLTTIQCWYSHNNLVNREAMINIYHVLKHVHVLALTVLVTTIDAQWEGMGDVGSARYEPALLHPCPTIRVLSYSN